MIKHLSVSQWLSMVLAVTVCYAPQAYALDEDEQALEAAIPSSDNLDKLKETIEGNPQNMDYYFSYAMLAKSLKEYEKAAWALEIMLRQNDQLGRVKLELGLVYIELERFAEARVLFMEVLQTNPPPTVQDNINKVLSALDERTKTHRFKTTLLTGFNSDSNANSAPSSGNVSIVDTTIPLGAGAGSSEDVHGFLAISTDHSYDIDVSRKRPSWRWKTSALAYHTEQDQLDNLNVQLYTVKTGPEVTFNEIPVQAHVALGYQHIQLDHESYLRNPKFEANLDYLSEQNIIFNYNYVWEYRDYLNSYVSTGFRGRTGDASQHKFGARHVISPKSIFGYTLMLRNETARQNFYSNNQVAFNLNYTYAFSNGFFANANAGYKNTDYIIPDFLVSIRDRRDDEYSASLALGYRIQSESYGDYVISGTYQFRDVQSTIQNYTYDNHRIGVSVAKEFEY